MIHPPTAHPPVISARPLVELFDAAGIPWRDILETHIFPPAELQVRYCLRDGDGKRYLANDNIASATVVIQLEWPTEGQA